MLDKPKTDSEPSLVQWHGVRCHDSIFARFFHFKSTNRNGGQSSKFAVIWVEDLLLSYSYGHGQKYHQSAYEAAEGSQSDLHARTNCEVRDSTVVCRSHCTSCKSAGERNFGERTWWQKSAGTSPFSPLIFRSYDDVFAIFCQFKKELSKYGTPCEGCPVALKRILFLESQLRSVTWEELLVWFLDLFLFIEWFVLCTYLIIFGWWSNCINLRISPHGFWMVQAMAQA